jgi:hypothetical protein
MTSSGTSIRPSPPPDDATRLAGPPSEEPEDRRLKAVGLGLLAAAAVLLWIATQRTDLATALALDSVVVLGILVIASANLVVAGLVVTGLGCGMPRPWGSPRGRQALLLQVVIANVLAPVLLFAMLSDAIDRAAVYGDLDFATGVASVAGYAFALLAWRLLRRARRLEAVDADRAMVLDPRPPVLYLRSFADDDQALIDDEGSALARRSMQLLRPPSPEEELAAFLRRLGPVVAIGKPGEPLPELGAARLYVAHDAWQAKVRSLMAQAGLVVVRVGTSPGVLWEIEQALAHVPRPRLVFTLLGTSRQGALAPAIVERLAPVLGEGLERARPEAPRRGWTTWLYRDPRRRMGGLIGFGTDGAVRTVAVSAWPLSLRDLPFLVLVRPSAAPLRRAWRSLLRAIDFPPASPAPRSRATAVLLAVFLGWAGAQWFYLGRRGRGWLYVAAFPLVVVAMPLSLADALRFVWADQAAFAARWGTAVRTARGA